MCWLIFYTLYININAKLNQLTVKAQLTLGLLKKAKQTRLRNITTSIEHTKLHNLHWLMTKRFGISWFVYRRLNAGIETT